MLENQGESDYIDSLIDEYLIHPDVKLYCNFNINNSMNYNYKVIQKQLFMLMSLRNLLFMINLIPLPLIKRVFDYTLLQPDYYRASIIIAYIIFGCYLPMYCLKNQEKPRIRLFGNYCAFSLFLGATIMNCVNGGFGDPTLFGIIFPPILSAMILDKFDTLIWVASSFVHLGIIYYLNWISVPFPSKRVIGPNTLQYHLSTTIIMLSITLILLYRFYTSLQFYHFRNQELVHLLQVKKNEAETARKDVEKYISRMSHEYRSPLQGITSLTELAIDEKDKPELVEKYLTTCLNVCSTLKTLIGDILTFFSSKHTPLTLNVSNVDVRLLVDSVLNSLQYRSNSNVKFVANISPEIKGIVGDKTRITQILFNLVGNSQKFTSHGFVTVNVDIQSVNSILKTIELDPNYVVFNYLADIDDTQKDREYICFEIKDTGIGISQENIALSFNPFVQADNTISRRFGGAGLGLSIVVDIVKVMKGIIRISSVKGEGTRICIAFPYTPADTISNSNNKDSPTNVNTSTLEHLRVLLCDDNGLNLKITKQMLKKIGIGYINTAISGPVALDICSKETFDVFLIDLHMPDMNGFELVQKLRQLTNENSNNIMIAFTADVNPGMFEQCHSSGFNGILTKPASRKDIKKMFKEAIVQINNKNDWIGCCSQI